MRRAIVRRRHQKNPFHTDTNAEAAEKEERVRDDEEVADAVAKSIKKIVTGTGERITDAIGYSIAEKEEKFVHGREIGVADAPPEEENNLAHALAERLAASKEKEFANARAVRDADRIYFAIGNSVADRDAGRIAVTVEKTWRA